ncbi:formyltransferase family protein [Nonomuraea roseoviolacea subsp. roseoviolacea]|uniref:Methionyl-tRNA formyltransferase n=1 Tax=Nonomuraea roseoviolacea subsp. carminata TaxID=160689 RepID=A0ABT1JUU4_9ACTN|nr:methionyl-tRNA formyltransferase [Nonomuraea roseoviolacea]MCP2345518.1 methionyl-tRNA formyltransferase [Nonomuraea roseoviolacea subsp. carminata]
MKTFAFCTGMEFAAPAVDVLAAQGTAPSLLIGYPPKLSHRSGYAPLQEAADKHGIPLLETDDINDGRAHELVTGKGIDLLVVAGWSQLVRDPLLSACPLGAIGLHPTRLPEGRGRAPLPWTIIKGLTSSAVSLFYLNEGADEGDLIAQRDFEVSRRDDVTEVYRKVTRINIELLATYVPLLLSGQVVARPQPPGGSWWERRRPGDGVIDWSRPAGDVYDFVRALAAPYPGAFTSVAGRRLYVHSADLVEWGGADEPPGTVLAPVWSTGTAGVLVACASGLLVVREAQWEGGERRDALALLEAGELPVGTRLGT